MATITDKIIELLGKREFVSVATVTPDGGPNTAPKFFFRAKGDFIYLIDYVFGKTVTNLEKNPRVSVSFMDMDSLEAYRLTGFPQLPATAAIWALSFATSQIFRLPHGKAQASP